MSEVELLIDKIDGVLYAAIVRQGRLVDLYADVKSTQPCWGAIYLGKVVKVDTKLDAAIVDLGKYAGLLPAKHVHHVGADASEARTGIGNLLKAGQRIVVQVKSEGRASSLLEGEKMARLTTKVYIPGNYLSYSPYSAQVTMSREIEDKRVLAEATALEGTGGWIVRAHAKMAEEGALAEEADVLKKEWENILLAAEAMGGGPGLLRKAPAASYRALYDYGAGYFEHIHAGTRAMLDEITSWCRLHLPRLAESKRLRLFKPGKPSDSLFDTYGLHEILEDLKSERIDFESGGSMIIERTSALTVIDINQGSGGKADAGHAMVDEIARHIRLRNLSGAILVDFIHSGRKGDRAQMQEALSAALLNDKAGAQMHGFTRLGLAEITRYRRDATWPEKLEMKATEKSKG